MARHRPHRPRPAGPRPGGLPAARAADIRTTTARHREYLATRLQQAHFDEGAVIIREGEPGAHFYIIVEGEAVASVQGRPLRTMGPGDGFGEIALLRDVPRTATVVTRGDLRTVTLHRTEFLAALANVESATAADALVRGRLRAGSWPEPQQTPGATEQ
jgi:CRP-like cAMP-binding protein